MSIPLKFSISAPGKVILHGEHSVVYGYQAIAASLNLRSRATCKINESLHPDQEFFQLSYPDVMLNLKFSNRKVTHQLLKLTSDGPWNINNPEKVAFDKLFETVHDFIKSDPCLQNLTPRQLQTTSCSLFLMAAMFHDPLRTECVTFMPFTLEFSSELPIGAGAGSSASFCVCLATAFLFISSTSTEQQRPFVLDENTQDLISRWAFYGECIMHGKPSGLDNSICTFGSAIAFQRPKTITRIPLNCCLRVLLVNTKVSRQTCTLVENVAKLKEHHKDVVGHVMQALDDISREAANLYKQMNSHNSDEELVNIFSRLEEIWSMNHSLLSALGVSHPSLERIVQLAREYKFNGKLTGAGGGGFAIILVPPQSVFKTPVEPTLKLLIDALQKEGFDVRDVELGGPGVQLH